MHFKVWSRKIVKWNHPKIQLRIFLGTRYQQGRWVGILVVLQLRCSIHVEKLGLPGTFQKTSISKRGGCAFTRKATPRVSRTIRAIGTIRRRKVLGVHFTVNEQLGRTGRRGFVDNILLHSIKVGIVVLMHGSQIPKIVMKPKPQYDNICKVKHGCKIPWSGGWHSVLFEIGHIDCFSITPQRRMNFQVSDILDGISIRTWCSCPIFHLDFVITSSKLTNKSLKCLSMYRIPMKGNIEFVCLSQFHDSAHIAANLGVREELFHVSYQGIDVFWKK
mmetsp:Transcript_17916/g.41995  ORF Transcript_17916/g.41995 Transcript_17916/m.41995 type:complete len:275 (+) Transcript_17916:449-1273(+)